MLTAGRAGILPHLYDDGAARHQRLCQQAEPSERGDRGIELPPERGDTFRSYVEHGKLSVFGNEWAQLRSRDQAGHEQTIPE